MIFQCKMCGGDLEVDSNSSVGYCEYCGTKQTIPQLDDEKIMHLFNRANHYRMKNDFENAMIAYQNILNEDEKNAEAYWGVCLCRYGIEYVTDPVTEKMLPTCHRTQFESILEDEDFQNACDKADSVARGLYKEEAERIDKIQKKILEISSREEDCDVFICYKEADEHGDRTPDSVLGQDIYKELTDEGMRVFFARISLEDKIGTAYEPYIFAALNSAKVMIVIGTKPEYLEAVWVKNEWSRFLSMMKRGEKKTLIPVYKTMSPYDMPEVFANIQSVNMEKLGAMQDLVRGIEKILGWSTKKIVHEEENRASTSSFAPLLERAQMYLEDSEWDKAYEYAERVLDMNPRCGEAYLVKFLVGFKFNHISKLSQLQHPFDDVNEYKKICQFGSEELKKELQGYNDRIIKEVNEREKPFLRRAENYLKDKEWEKAKEQADQALALEPECVQGYVIKLLAYAKVSEKSELADKKNTFDFRDEYKKIMRLGDEALRKEIAGYHQAILDKRARKTQLHYEKIKKREEEEQRKKIEEEEERQRKKLQEEEEKEQMRLQKEAAYREKQRKLLPELEERKNELQVEIEKTSQEIKELKRKEDLLKPKLKHIEKKRATANVIYTICALAIIYFTFSAYEFDLDALMRPEKHDVSMGMFGVYVISAMIILIVINFAFAFYNEITLVSYICQVTGAWNEEELRQEDQDISGKLRARSDAMARASREISEITVKIKKIHEVIS